MENFKEERLCQIKVMNESSDSLSRIIQEKEDLYENMGLVNRRWITIDDRLTLFGHRPLSKIELAMEVAKYNK